MSLNITILIDFHDCSSLSEITNNGNNGIRCINFAFINILYSFKRLLLGRYLVMLYNNSPNVLYSKTLEFV